MNAVSEQDLERLDELLDGALPPDEAGLLRERLVREPELSTALAELELDRAARGAVWTSLEPADAEAQAFAARVSTAARRQETWGHLRRYTRFGSAAAACMLIGYFIGWAGHDSGGSGVSDRSAATGYGTSVNQVSGELGAESAPRPRGRYRVPVGFDEQGRPITQDFDTLDEAQRFADEVRKLQELRSDHPIIIQERL